MSLRSVCCVSAAKHSCSRTSVTEPPAETGTPLHKLTWLMLESTEATITVKSLSTRAVTTAYPWKKREKLWLKRAEVSRYSTLNS